MKKLTYIIPVLIIVYYVFYYYVKNTGAEHGDMAPDFETELIDGTPFKLSDLRGEYVLIEFWASWCGPCIQANKNLVELQAKHQNKFKIVTIALEKSGDRWKSMTQKLGFNWKYQIVEKHKIVMLSDIARKYGVSEIPVKFMISPDGQLLEKMSWGQIDELLSDIK